MRQFLLKSCSPPRETGIEIFREASLMRCSPGQSPVVDMCVFMWYRCFSSHSELSDSRVSKSSKSLNWRSLSGRLLVSGGGGGWYREETEGMSMEDIASSHYLESNVKKLFNLFRGYSQIPRCIMGKTVSLHLFYLLWAYGFIILVEVNI